MAEKLIKQSDLGSGIVRLSLNDPATRNAMSEDMAAEFFAAISALRSNNAARVLILTGEGNAFSGGGHLDMLFEKTKIPPAKNKELMMLFYQQFLAIQEIEIPVIAAINGHAVGAGMCLCLGCDIRIAKTDAKLGLNFVRIGLHPGMGATFFLPRLVGPGRAAELLYCGKIISAKEGESIGLINHAVEGAQFDQLVNDTAQQIASAGPQAVRELKASLRQSAGRNLTQCLSREAECQAGNYAGREFLEGITAAREKREAKF